MNKKQKSMTSAVVVDAIFVCFVLYVYLKQNKYLLLLLTLLINMLIQPIITLLKRFSK